MWILAICFLVVTELLGLVGIEQTAQAPEPVRCMRKGCGCVDFLQFLGSSPEPETDTDLYNLACRKYLQKSKRNKNWMWLSLVCIFSPYESNLPLAFCLFYFFIIFKVPRLDLTLHPYLLWSPALLGWFSVFTLSSSNLTAFRVKCSCNLLGSLI